MSDFAKSWALSRSRFIEVVTPLNAEQLNWRLHPKALSIGQMALHVAGVELYFWAQLKDETLTGDALKLAKSATEGVVNDNPFPFTDEEITPEAVSLWMGYTKERVEPMITSPTPEILKKEIKTALGPMSNGEGAFTRFGFHAAYHHGQAYLYIEAPGFPT